MRACAEWRGLAGVGTIRVSSRLAWPCGPGATYARSPAAEASSESTLGERATRRVFNGRTSARSRMRAELALWWGDGRPREDCLGGGDGVECGESCEGCASLVRRRHCRLRLFLE
jgi:hypothetical protein